jgi:hypothetical protein
MVSAGPGRMVALVAACGVGWWASRRPQDLGSLLWLAALALSLRDLTESVMDAYYVWPTLALVVVVAARLGWARFGACALVAAGTGSLLDARFGPWGLWWGAMALGVAASLALSLPPSLLRPRPDRQPPDGEVADDEGLAGTPQEVGAATS